jgi:hypothetical protein
MFNHLDSYHIVEIAKSSSCETLMGNKMKKNQAKKASKAE